MERETKLARGELPGLDRATIHPYVDATPGPFYYQRVAHPVGLEAERVLGELEGGAALLFPSGAGATTALVLAMLAPGATVAIADGGYWGTVGLMESELGRWGVEVVTFDQTADPPPADLVWLEPCSNPRAAQRDQDTRVRYPGLADPVAARYVSAFGPLLSFDVADGEQAAAVERALELIENATSLGGVASTLEARARWEGSRVPAGLLRLSVGLEDVEDLWADLAHALEAV